MPSQENRSLSGMTTVDPVEVPMELHEAANRSVVAIHDHLMAVVLHPKRDPDKMGDQVRKALVGAWISGFLDRAMREPLMESGVASGDASG